jgi:anaerobic selenocysteine-containing dehydrogenase
MELTRRDFFKFSAAGTAGAAWATFGFDLEPAYAQASELKISRAKEIRSVCPYCGVGCSMIAYVAGHGETTSFNTKPYRVHIEGDPDSPINGGS